MKYLKTFEIARIAGVHPNTVRLYEEWGLLPPVPRSPAGYRLFTQEHADQVRLIRLVLKCTLFGRSIKHTAYQIIYHAAASDFDGAMQNAEILNDLIEKEYHQAVEAEKYLEQYACEVNRVQAFKPCGEAEAEKPATDVSIQTAAKMLNITVDMLRDWERNNLIQIPRDPRNGYRVYGPGEINRLRVIRALRRSNYSNMAILRAMQKLESGSSEGLRETLDCPELDEERGYLCFTDALLTALLTAKKAAKEIIARLREKQSG